MTLDAETQWVCERCGPVAIPSGSTFRDTRCPGCGGLALLTSPPPPLAFSCPTCGNDIPGDARACPSCNHGLQPSHPSNVGGCVTCGTQIVPRQLGGSTVHTCPTCGAMMVPGEVLEDWVRDEGKHAPAPSSNADTPSSSDLGGPVRYRHCPFCAHTMNRINFGPGSGVIVDVCTTHGTWLDPGELWMIVRFAHDGGLARARKRFEARRVAEHAALQKKASGAMIEAATDEIEEYRSLRAHRMGGGLAWQLLRWLVGM